MYDNMSLWDCSKENTPCTFANFVSLTSQVSVVKEWEED